MNPQDDQLSTHPELATLLHDGVLTIAMGTGSATSRLDPKAILILDNLLMHASLNSQVRVVVLRGAGHHFGSGLDHTACQQLAHQNPSELDQALYTLARWRQGRLRMLAVPIIALVEGKCLGAAVTLVEACDIVLCAHTAEFAPVDQDAPWLAREPAAQPCNDWLAERRTSTSADIPALIDGAQAQSMGLVTFSHPLETLEQELDQLLEKLCAKDALVLRFTKETLAHVGSMSWDATVSFTAAKFAEIKALQVGNQSMRATAITGFLAGKSKPGLGS